MATVGGVAGRVPATPQAGSMGKPPAPRRLLDFARRNEEHAWRSSAWIAVLLPLAALVFAVSVLAVKAWPAIRVNGWYFLYGRNWTYGNGYGTIAHTNGVAHPMGAQFGAWAIIWGTVVSSAHRHRHRRAALHRRRLRADRADAHVDLEAAGLHH